jgi:exosortase
MREEYAKNRDIRAVILVGGRDFGRCPLAARFPPALWPVGGKPALERLLDHLADEGIRQVVICSGGAGPSLEQRINVDGRLELKILDEDLPVGTAGCIRAAGQGTDGLLLVFSASMTCPPKVDALIEAHRDGQSDLTVIFNPSATDSNALGEPAGIYVCETTVLEHIPEAGYCDIKEGLIPEILRAGKTIHPAVLPSHVGNFRERQGYLCGIGDYVENIAGDGHESDLRLYDGRVGQTTDAGETNIDPSARVLGPVAIMKGASIAKGAAVFGPTVIGQNVIIDEDAVVMNSVLWDNSQVGANCEMRSCVVDYGAVVRHDTVVEGRSIPSARQGVLAGLSRGASRAGGTGARRIRKALLPLIDGAQRRPPSSAQARAPQLVPWLGAGIILAAFLWSYLPGIADLWKVWRRSDEYSSGLLVPFLAVYVLWARRHEIAKCPIGPSAWGMIVFLGAQTLRLLGVYFFYSSAERLSIVLSVAGLVLLLFGWHVFRKVGTTLLFLCLMLPWPKRVHAAVSLPLQEWATTSAIFCLEMMGYEIVPEGNVIHIGDSSVAVAEACNGLRMVTAFFVIGVLVVLLVRRAWWQKLIVLISCLPIALLCNTVRLALTAIAFQWLSGEHWEGIFHDFGGYAMMPLALGAIVAELWLLVKLTTPPTQEEAIVITRQGH